MSMPAPRAKKRHIIVHENPKSPAAEAYRSLRTNIQFSAVDEQIRTLMVTSAGPSEGKSTTASNLAATYAQADQKVLVIDADLRKPTAHHTFSASNRFGLTHVLTSRCQPHEVITETYIDNLYLMPSGLIPPNPSELLASNRMKQLLEDLKASFDMVIIDTPPLLAVADAQIVSTRVDGVVMVVDSGKVKINMAQKAKEKLDLVNARVLGVVLNNIKKSGNEEYYYYYYGETNS